MRASPLRLSATAAAAALVLAALGFAWHTLHFGLTDRAATEKLARDVRRLVAERTRQIQSLAERVANIGVLVEAAESDTNPDALSDLFSSLDRERRNTVGFERMSITVYSPSASRAGYRVLAWSDGAAEDIEPERLSGARALFVRPGTGGLLLVYVQPIEAHGRRVGVAAAETVLTPAAPVGATTPQLDTAFGPVTVELPALYQGLGAGGDEAGTFLISSANNEPLLTVRYSIAALSAERQRGYRRVIAVAALPLVVLLLLLTGPLLAGRARMSSVPRYIARSVMIAGLVLLGGAGLGLLLRTLGAPDGILALSLALGALAAVALLPASFWWRPQRRWAASADWLRFFVEQCAAGLGLAGLLWLLQRVSQDRGTAATAPREWALFPLDATGVARLLLQIAICWTLATSLAALAGRWRLGWRSARASALAVALWLVPAAVTAYVLRDRAPLPPAVWTPVAGAIISCALLATSLRRYYRRTTQAMRLVLLFSALYLPTLTLYPAAAMNADATTRRVIEDDYSPVLADQPRRVRAELARAQAEIDARWPRLGDLIGATPANPVRSQNAFSIWNTTSLSRSRLTSDIELYGEDRSLINRFALNIPEYTYNASLQKWQGSGCAWQTFDEPRRLGAEERRVFRAERGVCDPAGTLVGAIVIHVVLDYQALPFVANANPYAEVFSTDEGRTDTHLPDLQVVVYGWSLYPISPSGQMAWPIDDRVSGRLYRSREPFWETLSSADRRYHVHFTSDRTGFYAIGYPVSTAFDHATRLAELAAVTGVLFVGFLIGAAVYGPFAQRRDAPLRLLFNEIRTSFYRKLFLFFVFAAVMPVVMFALAFGAYMQSKFRADVVSEATSVVTVARRVLEELAAAELRPDQTPNAPTDDVMVWIGQVIHQHVNLFEGSQLKATSQRDLFESGLLPMRTPAAAYRSIVLDRLPTVVKDDRLGSLQYQVVASPVPSYGRDAVLSVPLALRQREIEQQIAELNRGVLAGAVVVVLFAAGLGASVAGRISDPVARLTRATRQIAAGQLDVRIVADTADELRRLVDDFNSMAATLVAQRAALARTNQLKAWNEMAVQVAHEIKNPLTPIQLSAEHLQRVHEDAKRPLGAVFDQCVATILRQVRLLRQIAGEFSNFAGEPVARLATVPIRELLEEVVAPYRTGLGQRVTFDLPPAASAFAVVVDRTLIARALTNVIENALHAMPQGGTLRVTFTPQDKFIVVTLTDTGVGMDAEAARRAFEPYFSTRTAGSGLGLANAKRNIELCGGTISLTSTPGRGTSVVITLPVAVPASPASG